MIWGLDPFRDLIMSEKKFWQIVTRLEHNVTHKMNSSSYAEA